MYMIGWWDWATCNNILRTLVPPPGSVECVKAFPGILALSGRGRLVLGRFSDDSRPVAKVAERNSRSADSQEADTRETGVQWGHRKEVLWRHNSRSALVPWRCYGLRDGSLANLPVSSLSSRRSLSLRSRTLVPLVPVRPRPRLQPALLHWTEAARSCTLAIQQVL